MEGLEQKIHLRFPTAEQALIGGAASRESGIGIRSMEERCAAGGRTIYSSLAPCGGTKIDAWVPIGS